VYIKAVDNIFAGILISIANGVAKVTVKIYFYKKLHSLRIVNHDQ